MKMRISLNCLFIGILLTASLYAENRYVTERMRITLRTGPDVSYKVIGLVASGESVHLIEESHKWSRVETDEGKRGWVMTRFLTTDIPKSDLLETLKKNHERLKEKTRLLSDENKKLKTENSDINKALSKKVMELKKLTETYENLNKGCQKYKELKLKHKRVTDSMKNQQKELIQLKQEKAVLESYQLFWGFGMALAILAAGFILGKTSQKKRTGRLY